MDALSSDWLGSEVMLTCAMDGCGCEELLLERAGAPVPLDCSISARENERVGGQSHTRMQEGCSKQQLLRIRLPTFHTARSRRNINRTVVYAVLLLLRQHGEQARAETQADSVRTKETNSSPRSLKSKRCPPRRQEELTRLQLLTGPPAGPGSGSGIDTSIGEDEKSEVALLPLSPGPQNERYLSHGRQKLSELHMTGLNSYIMWSSMESPAAPLSGCGAERGAQRTL